MSNAANNWKCANGIVQILSGRTVELARPGKLWANVYFIDATNLQLQNRVPIDLLTANFHSCGDRGPPRCLAQVADDLGLSWIGQGIHFW